MPPPTLFTSLNTITMDEIQAYCMTNNILQDTESPVHFTGSALASAGALFPEPL